MVAVTGCLCGHFEWCELCTPKPDPPGTKRDFSARVPVADLPDEKELALAARVRRAMQASMEADFLKVFAGLAALLLCSCAAVTADPRVLRLRKDGHPHCTAVVAGPLRVLTAAHCVMPMGDPFELQQDDGAPLEATDTNTWEPGVDLAFLHLAKPAPETFTIATVAPARGDELLLIGYGCAGYQQTRVLHALEPGVAVGKACHGDSGAPILNAAGDLVGIFAGWNSRGDIRYVQITRQP